MAKKYSSPGKIHRRNGEREQQAETAEHKKTNGEIKKIGSSEQEKKEIKKRKKFKQQEQREIFMMTTDGRQK